MQEDGLGMNCEGRLRAEAGLLDGASLFPWSFTTCPRLVLDQMSPAQLDEKGLYVQE
jgi:hypothetical protein